MGGVEPDVVPFKDVGNRQFLKSPLGFVPAAVISEKRGIYAPKMVRKTPKFGEG